MPIVLQTEIGIPFPFDTQPEEITVWRDRAATAVETIKEIIRLGGEVTIKEDDKQLDFLITQEDYDNIIQNDCFLCGKRSDENNTNGIDRMDSKKGYVLDNINTCCGECNYMKFTFDFNNFIHKLVAIYEKHKNNTYSLHNNLECMSIPRNRIKKSVYEIKEANEIFKQEQCEKIKEKYSEEEFKQIRIKEIAKYRTSKTV
jgi:hypothetical protein